MRGAANGAVDDRSAFAARYEPAVRAYLAARWRFARREEDLDDAVQEVFVECFRSGGALDKLDSERAGGFRAFFYGIVRNVALRTEAKRARTASRNAAGDSRLREIEADEASLSRVFDRAWAQSIMREAADLQAARSRLLGEEAARRIELLRLRFHDGLPIRAIADRWGADPVQLHREYSKARQEFRTCLLDVLRFYYPESAEAAEREGSALLELLAE